jgi:hypothetical protein
VLDEGLELDLPVEAAGVATRGLGVQVVPLDEDDAGTGCREVVGDGRAGDAATDDDDVGLELRPLHRRNYDPRRSQGEQSIAV